MLLHNRHSHHGIRIIVFYFPPFPTQSLRHVLSFLLKERDTNKYVTSWKCRDVYSMHADPSSNSRSIDVSVKTEENDVALSQASRSPFQLLIYPRLLDRITESVNSQCIEFVRLFSKYIVVVVIVTIIAKLDKYDALRIHRQRNAI